MMKMRFDDVVNVFVTSRASDKCQREKRKTINGDDLLWAMTTLGFEEYIEPLKIYLMRYREVCFRLNKRGNCVFQNKQTIQCI